MTKTVLLAAAASVALSAGGAACAANTSPLPTSAGSGKIAYRVSLPGKGLKTLYSQNANDAGIAVSSQDFESKNSVNTQGADDFVISAGSWTIEEVDVTGVYYNGSGPADSENVFFYADDNGTPGKLLKQILKVKGTPNGTGSFAIALGKKGATKLKAGTYWVSVQANCSFFTCGQWGWEVDSVQQGDLAMWQQPGGGPPCPSWNTLEFCLNTGPDLMFALKGKARK